VSGVRPKRAARWAKATTSAGAASSEVTGIRVERKWYSACSGFPGRIQMAKTTAGGRQTSNKAGVRSLAKKMGNSRHGFESQPASHKKAGAFAQESRPTAGRAKPGTSATREGKAAALRRVKMP
jgi:hypothetical protein